MARTQLRSKRKASSGRYHPARSKRKSELARLPTLTHLAEKRTKQFRVQGGNIRQALLSVKEASITDKKGKTQKTEILNVLENPANPNLVRRNILTKGTIIETKLGKAKVTSRPGQEGTLNAVLI
ncbi:30S ribosomal protein S8e [Candidatus Woesearchaeota archaeon]|nr:30S ribosomal protein S8e [Candidatus Woesearchaeota archaeon]